MIEFHLDVAAELLSADVPLTPEQVDNLQDLVGVLNTSAAEGNPLVANAVYDRLKDLLTNVAPQSPALQQLWDDVEDGSVGDSSEDGLDVHLALHPMESIFTVKDWEKKEFQAYCASLFDIINEHGSVDVQFSQKIDGHGVRVIYKGGRYVKATSRARSTRGRDLTRQLSGIVPQTIPVGQGTDLVTEVRGEICLRLDRFEAAKRFNPTLKTPFSAVSSLIKPSSTAEENSLLSFQAYRMFSEDTVMSFASRTEEYEALVSCGFDVPFSETVNFAEAESPEEVLEDIATTFEEFTSTNEPDFLLDGVIIEVSDFEQQDFMAPSTPDMLYRGAALALKVGSYSQGMYEGKVLHIKWTPGRVKLSPVLVVGEPSGDTPGVLVDSGNTVTNVPVYEPVNILHLEAYPGNPVFFYYGSESGVVPCFADGRLLTDSTIANAINDD